MANQYAAKNNKRKADRRRISIKVSPQTLYHLEQMATANGWSSDELGRIVDQLMLIALTNEHRHKKGDYKHE